MKERPSQRNQAVSISLGGLSLHPGFCGYQVGEQGFLMASLKVIWRLVSFSKDGILSWKMKLAV